MIKMHNLKAVATKQLMFIKDSLVSKNLLLLLCDDQAFDLDSYLIGGGEWGA